MDKIIDFFEKKLINISKEIEKHKNFVSDLINNITQSNEIEIMIKRNERMAELMIQTNKIIVILKEIAYERNNPHLVKGGFECRHDCFIENHVHNTVVQQIPFNKDHLFYGYEPFHEKLLGFYEEKEDYEKCSEIKNVILDQVE